MKPQNEFISFRDVTRRKQRSIFKQFEAREVGLPFRWHHDPPGLGSLAGFDEPRLKVLFKVFLATDCFGRVAFLGRWKLLRQLFFKFQDGTLNPLLLRTHLLGFHHQVRLVGVVQESHELIILLMRNGVVFMGVTLGASDGESHPYGPRRGHSIDHGVKAILQWIDPTLFIKHGVSMKTGRDLAFGSRFLEHVAGELLD